MPAVLLLLGAVSVSRATEPGYQVTVGFIETDNVQRLPSGTSDTLATQQVQFVWHDQRTRLDSDIDMDLSHFTFLHHTYGDEVIGNFLGRLQAILLPELLTWNFSDNFGQAGVDPFQAITPATIENINYFTTGPRLLLPLGSTSNLLEATAEYGNVKYQKSPLDSQRFSGGLGLVHMLSAASSLSVKVHEERIDYSDDILNPDYSSQQAVVRFDSHGSRTVIGADIGYGRLKQTSTTPSNVIAHLQMSRKVSASSAISLSLGREYSDAATAFVLTQTLGGANLNSQPVSQTGTPFVSNYATFGWNFARSRTGFGLAVSQYKDIYQLGGGLNDNRTQADANLSRQLTPTLQFLLDESFWRDQFENAQGSYSLLTTDAKLSWRVGNRVTLMFDYTHAKRESNLANTDYAENRIWLSIGYGRPAQAPPGPATPPLPRSSSSSLTSNSTLTPTPTPTPTPTSTY